MSNRLKFDRDLHYVVSFDAVSLYTNVNVERTIDYILDIIYENPIKFFPESEKVVKTGNTEKTFILKPPKKSLLKTVFMDLSAMVFRKEWTISVCFMVDLNSFCFYFEESKRAFTKLR